MIPPPIALGLTLCEKVIIEEGTRAATFVNTFSTLIEERFPTPPHVLPPCSAHFWLWSWYN